jgi:hypothetical protein
VEAAKQPHGLGRYRAQRDRLHRGHSEGAGPIELRRRRESPGPHGLYNAQLEGNKSRAIDFCAGDDLRERALAALIRAGGAHNLAKVKPARKEK